MTSRRNFLKTAALVTTGLVVKPASAVEITNAMFIPPEMEKLGFRYIDFIRVMTIPSIEIQAYTADLKDVPGTGHFTNLSYDPETTTATLESYEGETATFQIDLEQRTIAYENRIRAIVNGEVIEEGYTRKKLRYENIPAIKCWVSDLESGQSRNTTEYLQRTSFDYDNETGLFTINNKENGEVHREKLETRENMDIKVIHKRYLEIAQHFPSAKGICHERTVVAFDPNNETERFSYLKIHIWGTNLHEHVDPTKAVAEDIQTIIDGR